MERLRYVRNVQGGLYGSMYSNAYECLPSAMMIAILPASPTYGSVPESGTTATVTAAFL